MIIAQMLFFILFIMQYSWLCSLLLAQVIYLPFEPTQAATLPCSIGHALMSMCQMYNYVYCTSTCPVNHRIINASTSLLLVSVFTSVCLVIFHAPF